MPPTRNSRFTPNRSYSLPAIGLMTAMASEPGRPTSPAIDAESPLMVCTYSGIITSEPAMNSAAPIR